jgi:putative hydrolase of the HAD superfamily
LVKAVIWDFDETLARRQGGWPEALVDALAIEWPGEKFSVARLVSRVDQDLPWHHWQEPHPELSDPDVWWLSVEPGLAGALQRAGVPCELAHRAAQRARYEYVRIDRWSLFPDAEAALKRLRGQGWRQVILSNHCPELPEIVRGLGIAHYFDLVLTSAQLGFEKPHPAAFAAAKRFLGDQDQVWMIGDNPQVDVEGARSSGISAVLVHRRAPGCGPELELASAVRLIESRTSASRDRRDACRRPSLGVTPPFASSGT